MAIQLACDSEGLQQAISLLRQGELVAFPTETVYGLGAEATQPKAIQKIFEVKSRPKQQALSVLISEYNDIHHWARQVPPEALQLAKMFWPGPLTLIVPAASHVSPAITAGTKNIGLRHSSHPVVQALLKTLGAIVAPSANLTGHLSPTEAIHVEQQLGAYIPLILDGGSCFLGWESTLVDLTTDIPIIRRAGVITLAQIQAICPNAKVQLSNPQLISKQGKLNIQMMSYDHLIHQVVALCQANINKIAVLAHHDAPEIALGTHVLWVRMPSDVGLYQKEFYAQLHRIQQQAYDFLWVESPPQESDWMGVHAKLATLVS